MIEEKLTALGLLLPLPAEPAFNYAPVAVHCGSAYLSGQLPKIDGDVRRPSKVGAEVSGHDAAEAARICILQALACLKAAIGGLRRVERALKVTGFVASPPGLNGNRRLLTPPPVS